MSVTKAIIPAAGLGTRLKPITDIIPKELLPIGTKPSLYYVLEEAKSAGIKEIILVISDLKHPFFKHLEEAFANFSFHFVDQKKPLGLGHAVNCGEKIVGDHPFLVMLPDILIDNQKSASLQLIEVFRKTGASINAAEREAKEKLSLYGIYDIESSQGRLHKAKAVVEKPRPGEAPSDLAVLGRYLFTPELFSIQKKTPPGHGGEIQLADAMNTLAKEGKMYAYEIEGEHLDVGTPEGYLRANLYYGIKNHGKSICQGLI